MEPNFFSGHLKNQLRHIQLLTYTFILEISITETRIVNNSFNTSTRKTFSYYHRLSGWGYTDFYRNTGKNWQ